MSDKQIIRTDNIIVKIFLYKFDPYISKSRYLISLLFSLSYSGLTLHGKVTLLKKDSSSASAAAVSSTTEVKASTQVPTGKKVWVAKSPASAPSSTSTTNLSAGKSMSSSSSTAAASATQNVGALTQAPTHQKQKSTRSKQVRLAEKDISHAVSTASASIARSSLPDAKQPLLSNEKALNQQIMALQKQLQESAQWLRTLQASGDTQYQEIKALRREGYTRRHTNKSLHQQNRELQQQVAQLQQASARLQQDSSGELKQTVEDLAAQLLEKDQALEHQTTIQQQTEVQLRQQLGQKIAEIERAQRHAAQARSQAELATAELALERDMGRNHSQPYPGPLPTTFLAPVTIPPLAAQSFPVAPPATFIPFAPQGYPVPIDPHGTVPPMTSSVIPWGAPPPGFLGPASTGGYMAAPTPPFFPPMIMPEPLEPAVIPFAMSSQPRIHVQQNVPAMQQTAVSSSSAAAAEKPGSAGGGPPTPAF